jgi:membrane protease YdiL (CAAX protease family)
MTEPADDGHAYIDLARLGRTGFWVGARGFGRILLYLVVYGAVFFTMIVALVWWKPTIRDVLDQLSQGKAGPLVEFGVILSQSVGVLWAVRDATVRTQRRPFLSLVGATGRIEPRPLLAGAVAMLASLLGASLVVGAVAGLVGGGPDQVPDWHVPDLAWLLAAVLGLIVVPLQAGGEELLFRGWLTQTLGQGIRNRVVLALVVGVLFALAHGVSPGGLAYFTILSLGLSAVSLRAQRLELAIGAHVAQNLFVLLVVTPFFEGGEPTLLGSEKGAIGLAAAATACLQSGLFYWLATAPGFQRWFGCATAK